MLSHACESLRSPSLAVLTTLSIPPTPCIHNRQTLFKSSPHLKPPKQVPLILLTELLRKRLKEDTVTNMIFWGSFCMCGQPLCLILYYYDYSVAQGGDAAVLPLPTQPS